MANIVRAHICGKYTANICGKYTANIFVNCSYASGDLSANTPACSMLPNNPPSLIRAPSMLKQSGHIGEVAFGERKKYIDSSCEKHLWPS